MGLNSKGGSFIQGSETLGYKTESLQNSWAPYVGMTSRPTLKADSTLLFVLEFPS